MYPVNRNKCIADGEADGTDENNDGQFAERFPVVAFFSCCMSFYFFNVGRFDLFEDFRHEMVKQCGKNDIDDAEND